MFKGFHFGFEGADLVVVVVFGLSGSARVRRATAPVGHGERGAVVYGLRHSSSL